MISEKLSTDSRRMLQKGVPQFVGFCRCTPCRQRRGKERLRSGQRLRIGCTPCRQRRGKGIAWRAIFVLLPMHPVQAAPRQRRADYRAGRGLQMHPVQAAPRQSSGDSLARAEIRRDAPRAGSAEAKEQLFSKLLHLLRCTPCRQRRGKVIRQRDAARLILMHPVQAAPRQRTMPTVGYRRLCDAPRAGSAEAKVGLLAGATVSGPMHPVQAAHSEITTCRPMVL